MKGREEKEREREGKGRGEKILNKNQATLPLLKDKKNDRQTDVNTYRVPSILIKLPP